VISIASVATRGHYNNTPPLAIPASGAGGAGCCGPLPAGSVGSTGRALPCGGGACASVEAAG
jgi:hypothetical protein